MSPHAQAIDAHDSGQFIRRSGGSANAFARSSPRGTFAERQFFPAEPSSRTR